MKEYDEVLWLFVQGNVLPPAVSSHSLYMSAGYAFGRNLKIASKK